jgi:glutamyl-Q tRNA(Asp) synthetase
VPIAVDPRGEKLSKQTLAKPIERESAVEVLALALRFLGQCEVERGAPRRMLQHAVDQWDPAAIPRVVTQPAPG